MQKRPCKDSYLASFSCCRHTCLVRRIFPAADAGRLIYTQSVFTNDKLHFLDDRLFWTSSILALCFSGPATESPTCGKFRILTLKKLSSWPNPSIPTVLPAPFTTRMPETLPSQQMIYTLRKSRHNSSTYLLYLSTTLSHHYHP